VRSSGCASAFLSVVASRLGKAFAHANTTVRGGGQGPGKLGIRAHRISVLLYERGGWSGLWPFEDYFDEWVTK
jgi:hypothetical protein